MRARLRTAVAVVALTVACGTTDTGPSASPSTPPGVSASAATAAVAVLDAVPDLHPSVDDWEDAAVELVTGDGTVHVVRVRVARTPAQRAHGLMEVPELPTGAGMWFVYEEERDGGFWMKNTRVPLDITYVDVDGRIVDVVTAEPCIADPCPTYPPDAPYRRVLEVPAGWMDEVGAGVGDVARLATD